MPRATDVLIGRIAVQRGFTTEDRVRECLELVYKNRAVGYDEDLAAVLQKRGYIRELDLRALHREVALALFVQAERFFAKVCVERRILAESEARRLLEEQAKDGYRVRLGELLIKQGKLDQARRDQIAEEQVRRQEQDARTSQRFTRDPSSGLPLPPPPAAPPLPRETPQVPISLRSRPGSVTGSSHAGIAATPTHPLPRPAPLPAAVSNSNHASLEFGDGGLRPLAFDSAVASPPGPAPPPPPPDAPLPTDAPVGPTPAVSPRALASLDHDRRRYSSTSGTFQLDTLAKDVVPGFELMERIGQGPSGVVYRAKRSKDGEVLGLKVLSPALGSEPGFFNTFRSAWAQAKKFEHPRAVKLDALGKASGDLIFFTQALVEGESLQDRVDRGGPLPPPRVLELAIEALEVLQAAHAQSILHGGLGPRNVILKDGHAVITDVGLSAGAVPGLRPTPGFSSPQLLQGQPPCAADDVYAAGCLVFFALTGRAPFDDPGTSRSLSAADPGDDHPGVDPRLSSFIKHTTHPDRTARPQDAGAALALLRPLGGLTSPPPPPPPPDVDRLGETMAVESSDELEPEGPHGTQALPAVKAVDLKAILESREVAPGDPILRTQELPQIELPILDETHATEDEGEEDQLAFDPNGQTREKRLAARPKPPPPAPVGLDEPEPASRRWALDLDPFSSARNQAPIPAPSTGRLPAVSQDLTGKLIHGRYKVLERLGQGAMGEVWKAEHTLMGRTVALKLLAHERVKSQDSLGRFQREILAMAQFQHPNVVRVFDAGTTESGRFYISMEYVAGRSLAKVLEEERRLPPERALRFLAQALRGMGEGHKRQIVHRDLKTDNLLVVPGEGGKESIKILDFGVAKVLRSEEESPQSSSNVYVTTERVALGTPEYMSPEQASGTETVDHRSDIYSLGVVAYEMLTGKLPFEADSPVGYLGKHILDPPRSFAEAAPDLKLPPELERFVVRALEKDPADRWQSASEMLAALEQLPGAVLPVESGSGHDWKESTASSPKFAVPPSQSQSSSGSSEGPSPLLTAAAPRDPSLLVKRLLLALAGVAGLLLLLIAVAFSFRSPRPETRVAELEPLMAADLAQGKLEELRAKLSGLKQELDPAATEKLLRPWQDKLAAGEAALKRLAGARTSLGEGEREFQGALGRKDWSAAVQSLLGLEARLKEAQTAHQAVLAAGITEGAGTAPELDRVPLEKELNRRQFEEAFTRAEALLAKDPPELSGALVALQKARDHAAPEKRGEVEKRLASTRHRLLLQDAEEELRKPRPDPNRARQKLEEARRILDSPEAARLEEEIARVQAEQSAQGIERELDLILGRLRGHEEQGQLEDALRQVAAAEEILRAQALTDRWDLPGKRASLEAAQKANLARQALPELPAPEATREAIDLALSPRRGWLLDHPQARDRAAVEDEVRELEAHLAKLTRGGTGPDPGQPDVAPGAELLRAGKIEEARAALQAELERARAANEGPAVDAATARLRQLEKLATLLERSIEVAPGVRIARFELTNAELMGFLLTRTKEALEQNDEAALKRARALWPAHWEDNKPAELKEFPQALKRFKSGTHRLPAGGVTWNAAVACCEWLSLEHGAKVRLPSEAEWLAACGPARPWPWGASFDANKAMVLGRGPVEVTDARGTHEQGGVLHLIGNVAEWTSDPFPGAPAARVLKGGSSRTLDDEKSSVTFREKGGLDESRPEWGLRVVVDLRP